MSGALRGVGLALVEVPRFRALLERRGDRLLARVFSDAERAYAQRKLHGWQNLAARFAAKSAGRAALRGALGRTLPLAGLEVARLRSGEPKLVIRDGAAPGGEPLEIFLTLTHDADFALASVVVETRA